LIRITIFFVAALILVLGTSPLVIAQDSFPGNKNLNYGPDPIGIGKNATTAYQFTIHLHNGYDNTAIVKDVIPAEFDITDLSAFCGVAESKAPGKSEGKGNPYKLQPDIIIWNLDGCDSNIGQSLEVTIQTDENPGHAKRGIDFFEPTECGPLFLNDGAVMIDPETFEDVTEPSNSLSVATCLDESDTGDGCVDGDNDGWSVDCGDCDDSVGAINPGAEEICGDLIDNNCDGYIDEGCLPAIPG
jgi:hypothetical protein